MMLRTKKTHIIGVVTTVFFISACGSESMQREGQATNVSTPSTATPTTSAPNVIVPNIIDPVSKTPTQKLNEAIITASDSDGLQAFILPQSDDWENIPQDPNNPLNADKVLLGKMLFHETALSTQGVNSDRIGTWSCASCHHADAGFKSGITQGIGEGGEGFGPKGTQRVLAENFDADSPNPAFVPDVQPVTSPTILNTAYQDVMLWNGQFGNAINGIVNNALPMNILATPDTPKTANNSGLSGLEVQAIAGTGVHRLKTSEDSILQTNPQYIALFNSAFPNGAEDVTVAASKAMAAYERTVLANQAPFQEWLKGDTNAMSNDEIAGATLFFGKAGCSACHTGPGLSSPVGATADEIFFAIGFADFDPNDPNVTGSVDDATSRGRGGFTGQASDNYKFKVPQLYNLKDTNVFGHGASFSSVKEVIEYKNAAISQKALPASVLDYRFTPLGLSESEIDQLVLFLEESLYDPNLRRYVPLETPSGNCVTVNDPTSKISQGC